jgi:hypothetical protein
VRNSPTLGTSNNYVSSTVEKDFKAFFAFYIPNSLVGYTNVNFIFNKVKGDSAFPRKPSPPRVLLQGYSPLKMVIFRKKIHCKHAKYVLTQTSGEFTQDASGQRAKTRELGIAHASNRIWPFPSPLCL